MDKKDIIIDLSNVFLQTEKLTLRPWKKEDVYDLFDYASVNGVGEPAGWLPHKSIEESQQILDSFINQKDVLAIELKQNNKVIGSIGVHQSGWAAEDSDFCNLNIKEIGYALSKDYWGQGLMPQAVSVMISHLFKNHNLDALSCCYFAENIQSKRVIEKCGFRFLKIGKYYSKVFEEEFNDYIYIMDKLDFKKTHRQ